MLEEREKHKNSEHVRVSPSRTLQKRSKVFLYARACCGQLMAVQILAAGRVEVVCYMVFSAVFSAD